MVQKQSVFLYLQPLKRDLQVCQTNGQTDILVALTTET